VYEIKAVEAVGGYVDAIRWMDRVCFPQEHHVSFSGAHWWMVFDGDDVPVAYAGLTYFATGVAFLSRVGVLPGSRGNGLQRRLIRCRERRANRDGYPRVVSYTTPSNTKSSNNLIHCGYRLYVPPILWAGDVNYWEKGDFDMATVEPQPPTAA
jgi:GNAT superfamily N-acetyltransferase